MATALGDNLLTEAARLPRDKKARGSFPVHNSSDFNRFCFFCWTAHESKTGQANEMEQLKAEQCFYKEAESGPTNSEDKKWLNGHNNQLNPNNPLCTLRLKGRSRNCPHKCRMDPDGHQTLNKAAYDACKEHVRKYEAASSNANDDDRKKKPVAKSSKSKEANGNGRKKKPVAKRSKPKEANGDGGKQKPVAKRKKTNEGTARPLVAPAASVSAVASPRSRLPSRSRKASGAASSPPSGLALGPDLTLGRPIRRAGLRSTRQASTQSGTVAAHSEFIRSGVVTASVQYYVSPIKNGAKIDVSLKPIGEIFAALGVATSEKQHVQHGTGLVLTRDVDAEDVILTQTMPFLRGEDALEQYEAFMDYHGLYGAVIWLQGDPGAGDGGVPLVEVVREGGGKARLYPTALYYVNRGTLAAASAHRANKSGKRRKAEGTANTRVSTALRKCTSGEFEVTIKLVATTRIGFEEEALWTYYGGAKPKELCGFGGERQLYNRISRGAGCGYYVAARASDGDLSSF